MATSAFAPVYRPTRYQQTFFTQQRKAEAKKRNRQDLDGSEDEASSLETVSANGDWSTRTPTFRPVNRTDPYFIAGHPREKPLPAYPFPYAADTSPLKPSVSLNQELANLNPPLFVKSVGRDEDGLTLKRRHLDNLTAILHRCVLRRDWQRASRVWGLLLRTEIAGSGIDLRQHGRWALAAEILMRRKGMASSDGNPDLTEFPPFPDEGLELARAFYERLILQFPHRPQVRLRPNATVFFLALFNIWIYEVQNRSTRAREAWDRARSSPPLYETDGMRLSSVTLRHIRERELREALLIAQRIDELLLNPPYDTDPQLLQIRAMSALWIADLYRGLGHVADAESNEDSSSREGSSIETPQKRRDAPGYDRKAQEEIRKAMEMFKKLEAIGVWIPEGTFPTPEDGGDEALL